MKTKKSKRFLALLLSVLMVLTSVPLAAFTAFGAAAAVEDPAVTEVQTAMRSYEEKLDSRTVYTNMSAAYEAYVACQEALDAYQYGSTKNDDGTYNKDFSNALSGKAKALTDAIANMSEFKEYTGTGHGTFPNDANNVSAADYAENYKNILYSAPVTTEPAYYGENVAVSEKFNEWFQQHQITADVSIFMSTDTVMLYDGKTNPQTGVMLGTWGNSKPGTWNWNNLSWYYCYVGTGTGLSMVNDLWSKKESCSKNNTWYLNYQGLIRQPSDSKSGACNATRVTTSCDKGVNGMATANAIQFNKEFDTLFYTIMNPAFEYRMGIADRGDQQDIIGQTKNTTIRVLNYKLIMQKIEDQKKYLPNVENYKQGGLSSVMLGFDQATTDPNSFFTTSNDWQGAQNHYQTAINNLESAAAVDNSEYNALRSGLKENVKYGNTYNKGSYGWTPESWATFKAAYEKVADIMSAPYTSGTYVEISNAQTLIDELDAAYNGLVSNLAYADTTELVASIQKFRSWENIFTEETYKATTKYVDDAVIAVWKQEEDFGIKTCGPLDTTEGNKLVNDQLTLVNDSIALLRISPDAKISTSHGKYSLNQALAIVVDNPSQYFNYNEFTTAVENGNTYKSTLPTTEFTDYTTLYNKYVEEVTKVVDAYYNLAFAFTDIPDGTVVQNSGFTRTNPQVAQNNGAQSISFGYTNSAVLIRTTHESKAMPYGKFSITFGTNISASNSGDKNDNKNTNNGLDSITLNATAEQISGNFLQASKANGALDRKVPEAMSADQLAMYPGLLEYNGFSVSNLRYVGKSSNCDPLYIITDNDGNKVATTDEQARNVNLDPILGKTDGANNGNVVKGSVYAYSTNSGYAYTYIDGDLNVTVDASPEVELTMETQPFAKNYRLSGNYLGAITSFNDRYVVYRAGRCWYTTRSTGDSMDTSVAVVDMSYLIDLVKMCDQLIPLKSKYTEASFAKLEQALYDAKAPYDYTKQSAGNIASTASTRYAKLFQAYRQLIERPQILTFNYMDENGQPTSAEVEIEYNANIATVRDQIDAITVPNYSSNGMSYTFKSWSPAVNNATVITSDTIYTAVYDSFATAYWGNFNASKDALLNLLANGKFSAEALNEAKAQIEELQYFTYTDNQKLMVSAANQTAIDNEKAAMDAVAARLAEIALDSSTYDAIVKTIDTLNADAYDVAAVEATMSATSAGTTVTISGVDYTGWDYDNYVKTALEVMNGSAFQYTVLVYDINYTPYYVAADGKTLIEATYDDNDNIIVPDGAGQFKYGDPIAIQNPIAPGEPCKFDVTIIAQNTQVQTTPKYVGTLTEYTFNVRGNTEVSTDAGETTDYVINFVDSRNNTLVYTSYQSKATLSRNDVVNMLGELPTVPFYTISSLTNRVNGSTPSMKAQWKLGEMVAPDTKIINITINYVPEEQTGYNIILLDENGTEIYNAPHNWNEKVDLTATGAAGMIDTATGKLIAYGSSYSFYACQSVTLQAVNSTDGKVAVSVAAPVISNGKVYFTGSFAKDGFDRYTDKTVKGYGIVMDVLGSHPDLTLKDVSNQNYVFNLASSSLTCGNQFTVYTNQPSMTTPVNYRAYVIYDVNGAEVIEYSDVVTTTIG